MQKGVLTQQRLAVLLGTKIFDRVRKEKEEVNMAMNMNGYRMSLGFGREQGHHHFLSF